MFFLLSGGQLSFLQQIGFAFICLNPYPKFSWILLLLLLFPHLKYFVKICYVCHPKKKKEGKSEKGVKNPLFFLLPRKHPKIAIFFCSRNKQLLSPTTHQVGVWTVISSASHQT
eukprot:TRINITY_DN1271_c0_g2_i1.p1 TRINITY_DN1271_c0_g2~~TRINITY_DN1271_c0_g2_i1.p1  ORF type:complete len:114 (+),score=11.12 TRINITY_DN1271_c0_g2_i1:206-547(+)